MNKKIFSLLIFGVFLLAFAPLISAGILDSANFDSTDGEYGSYMIDSYLPEWLGGGERASIKLLQNTNQCLIDCSATLEGYFFESRSLVDQIQFKDNKGNLVTNIRDLNFRIGQYENIEYEIPIYEEVCEDIMGNPNNSTSNIVCSNIQTDSYIEFRNEFTWKNYQGGEIIGYFQLEINAKKNPNQKVDWIIEVFGEKLTAWAWWDTDWEFKREISNLNGSISALYNITWVTGMKEDFGDLRFIDFGTELIELNYTIVNKIDNITARIRVNNLNVSQIYMYYGNPAVSTTQNASKVFFNPVSGYFFDNANANDFNGINNGTVVGATFISSGYIGGAYSFDGINDYIDTGTQFFPTASGQDVSFFAWVKTTNDTANKCIVSQLNGAVANRFGLCLSDGIAGRLRYFKGGPTLSIQSSINIDDGNWNHLGFVQQGNGTTTLYINGVANTGSNSDGRGFQAVNTLIGTQQVASNSWDGDIDEAYFYNRALNANEILKLKGQTQPNFITGMERENQAVNTVLINPSNDSIFTNISINFLFSSEPNEVNLTNATLYIWNETNSLIVTNFTLLSGNETVNTTFSNNLIQGNYLWNAETCAENTNCSFADFNFSFTVHTESPQVNISDPTGIIPFIKIGNNETLNYSIAEIGENTTEHIVNCFYTYNNINNTLNCSETSIGFEYILDINNITVTAIDIFGLVATNETNWQYDIVELNAVFNNISIEATSETFEYFFKTPFNIVTTQFNYDGISFTANVFTNGTNQYRLTSTIQVPSVNITTNFTFNFAVQTDNNGLINSTEFNQTVTALSIDNCSINNFTILTSEIFDERDLTNITADIEVSFTLFNPDDSSEVAAFNNGFLGIHEFTSCSNINLTSENYLFDLEIRYSQPGLGDTFNYVPEFYHIQKAATSTLPQDIDLFDLNQNQSTEFTIFYRDDNYVIRPNVLFQILRAYVDEGIFRTVEIPISSSEGSAIGHFDLNNYKYKIIVTENSEVLNIFNNPAIVCESAISGICTITLKGEKTVPLSKGVTELNDFQYTATQTNDTIEIIFSSPTGTNKEVNVVMIQSSPLSDDVILCNTTLLSSAGSISCNTVQTIGDSSVSIEISSDGETQAYLTAFIEEDLSSAFLLDNYFIGALLLILLMGMGISSPQIMIWIGVFGLVVLGALFLLKSSSVGLTVGAITWLITSAIIATVKINKRTES